MSTLHWWSQPNPVALSWGEQLVGALEYLQTGLEKDSEAIWETRRGACLKLLGALCETINNLMSNQAQKSSQEGNTTDSPAESPSPAASAGAGEGAAPEESHVTASQLPHVDPTAAPRSDQSIPARDRDGERASRTDDERVRQEFNPTGGGFPGGASGADVQRAAAPRQTFNRVTSKGEHDTFRVLFKVVHATPRKIKRVVNV